jgi:hypothetical protein
MNVGRVFTVTVGVSGLVGNDLYGFDILLKWDTNALQYLTHEIKVPVETYPQGVLHSQVLEVKNEVNEADGTYWIAYASLAPAEPFNGDGVFFTITFIILKEFDNGIMFEHVFLVSDDYKTIPVNGQQIACTPVALSDSYQIDEHRERRAEKWLEWWITITLQMTQRRPSSSGR